MKRLKKNVFLVVFLILTLITAGILCVYNVQLYSEQARNVERGLNRTVYDTIFDELMPVPKEDRAELHNSADNIRFMDTTVYTVIMDEDQNILRVINHSNNEMDDEDIAVIALTAVQDGLERKTGNLYFTKYSYAVNQEYYVTIVDNTNTNAFLLKVLVGSLTLFAVLELLYVLIARKIAASITNPVAESFEKQKQFIADASHELKTPLAVIIASADALESNPAESKWLANIKSESDRMSKLIADLLELAKTEEVNDRSEFALGNLSKTVEMSALTFESVMFEKGILLNDDIEDGIELFMNSYKIKQLMSILLDNAIQHSAKGGEIEVTLKKSAKEIRLTVTNQGEGIPKGDEEKIFERFYRADAARNRNENRYGLGLAIARNIVTSHEGEIHAKSENGRTAFTVTFPA